MGSAADEAVGDSIASGTELLGAGADGNAGVKCRCEGTETADSNIQASSGDTLGRVWLSTIDSATDNSAGWCSAAQYVYVAVAGGSNNQSDPGADAVLDIGVEYY